MSTACANCETPIYLNEQNGDPREMDGRAHNRDRCVDVLKVKLDEVRKRVRPSFTIKVPNDDEGEELGDYQADTCRASATRSCSGTRASARIKTSRSARLSRRSRTR
jgi:hypothetical protein